MEIKQLEEKDAESFSNLIKDMYSNLENLEWFSPMPFDLESVIGMITKPRFYIIGAFENNELCGVSCIDYKCGKLLDKLKFPDECDTSKLVEIGFNIVHSAHRGKGIMKLMVEYLIAKLKDDGFLWAFAKVHKDNRASSKSLIKNNFHIFDKYRKPVKIEDFKFLSSQDFFSSIGKRNAENSLKERERDAENIYVDYNLLIKQL